MNKYDSGYIFAVLIKRIGWAFVFLSVALGVFLYFTAPRGLQYMGLIVVLAGSFQAIILVVFGVVVEAILDIAKLQSKSVDILNSILDIENLRDKKYSSPAADSYDIRYNPVNQSQSSVHSYRGFSIIKNLSGAFVDDKAFANIDFAKRWIDEVLGPENG